jgi:membrane protease YdiL (CAAX protease family)
VPVLFTIADSSAFHWIWPALPALFILLTSWIVQRVLRQYNVAPWWKANYTRMAGIFVFIMFAFSVSADHRAQLYQYFQDQLPVSTRDVVFIVSGLAVLGLMQSGKLGKVNVRGLEQYRFSGITPLKLFGFTMVWIIYLIFYELYFRGFLLFVAFPDSSITWIIVYNIVLYALIHVSKNRQQVLLSVPFGLLLCVVTVYTGHIWFAIVLHIGLALGFELPLLMTNRKNKLILK